MEDVFDNGHNPYRHRYTKKMVEATKILLSVMAMPQTQTLALGKIQSTTRAVLKLVRDSGDSKLKLLRERLPLLLERRKWKEDVSGDSFMNGR